MRRNFRGGLMPVGTILLDAGGVLLDLDYAFLLRLLAARDFDADVKTLVVAAARARTWIGGGGGARPDLDRPTGARGRALQRGLARLLSHSARPRGCRSGVVRGPDRRPLGGPSPGGTVDRADRRQCRSGATAQGAGVQDRR